MFTITYKFMSNNKEGLMSRIDSVDTVKLIAITAVIAIHTNPFSHNTENVSSIYYCLNIIINQLARFAVPFFCYFRLLLWY
jgi:surface polysaccharide O-acyltransferase-like enzyme